MDKTTKKNLFYYPMGTVGRDMVYALFTNFTMLYILYTRNLTSAQLAAVSGIMIAARIFDAFNDPIMGNIIERTRTKWGKYKPWLAAGVFSTSIVVYLVFNTDLKGWNFIYFYGLMYFMYSITYTMCDISYWGMIPSLSKDGNTRDRFTSKATLFAGIGSTLVSVLVPLFTTGNMAIGGSTFVAYGRIALIICLLAPFFVMFTLVGVHESRDYNKEPVPPVSFKKILSVFLNNDQLIWIAAAFLVQQIGTNIALGGVASNYIYFEFGYEGGLYSTFTTIGMMATAVLMIFYPMIAARIPRKKNVKYLLGFGVVGYAAQLLAGFLLPATNLKYWIITIGFMLSNLGQYGLYLIMMISIINTVEYNEYKNGTRDETIITSLRPLLTKMSSAIVVLITTISYLLFKVTDFTNRISDLESMASMGTITAAEKSSQIAEVISGVGHGQTLGLLGTMAILPCVLMIISVAIYSKKYMLTEEYYAEICKELENRKK